MRVVNPLFIRLAGNFLELCFNFSAINFSASSPRRIGEIKSVNQNISDFMFKFSPCALYPSSFRQWKNYPIEKPQAVQRLNRNGFCDIRRSQLIPTTFLQKFSNLRKWSYPYIKRKNLSNRPEFSARSAERDGQAREFLPTPLLPSLACRATFSARNERAIFRISHTIKKTEPQRFRFFDCGDGELNSRPNCRQTKD